MMSIGVYDVLAILSILILSFQICLNILPGILKSEKVGDKNYVAWIVNTLEKMFIKVTQAKARQYIWGSTIFVSLFIFSIFFFASPVFASIMLFPGFVAGRMAPGWVINYMMKKRIKTFNLQMVDGLSLLSNALKAGLSIAQGLENVAKQMPNPISQEFNLVLNEQKVGVTMEESFINLGKRVPCEDVDMFVTAVIILRETGGNLSETFDTIVDTIRERIKIQQKISALVSQGVMQGLIIFLMPFALGGVFYWIDPNHIRPMLNTLVGNLFVLAMLSLQLIGGFIMWKIVKIEV